jgi:signal transduction histidine kinase/ligand-binding sensor domain-containing protein
VLRTAARVLSLFCAAAIFSCAWLADDRLVAAPATNYFTRLWQTEDGLPQNSVSAIIQSKDGYLWLGTYSGLARFDGVRFICFNKTSEPKLNRTRITSLFEDSDGAIWMGNETGEVARYRHGGFDEPELPAGWERKSIYAISADETGAIWLINTDGIMVCLRDGVIRVPPSGTATGQVGVARDRDGFLWITRNGRLSRIAKGNVAQVRLEGEPPEVYVQGICPARAGGIWVACAGRVRNWKDHRWAQDLGAAPWGVRGLTAMIERESGSIAAGTVDAGLYLINSNSSSLHLDHTTGLAQNWVRCLCVDAEQDLWMGAGSSGLLRLRAGNVAALTPPGGWEGHPVLSMSRGHDDGLWITTEGGGVYHFKDGDWKRFGTEDGLANLFAWSAAEDEEGQLWVGTWGGGIFLKKGDKFVRAPGFENFTAAITAILHAPDHVTWIGSSIGLLRYERGKVISFGEKEGLRSGQVHVRTIERGPDGTIWFGMTGGGLGRLGKDGRLTQFREKDGLSSDDVQSLKLEADGTLWVGTSGGGLNRFHDGKFAAITKKEGLDDEHNVVNHIEEDTQGFFWMSTHNGILRVSKAQLNACADGKTNRVNCLNYGKKEGLPNAECSGGMQPSGCSTADGRFCFPTITGAVTIDPAAVRRNELPPPVIIEEVLVEEKPVARSMSAGEPIRVQPGQQHFQFRYTGLSFVAPEKVQFKYRLRGFENEWRETAERSVPYGYLPPGDYLFEVTACNNDGVWNPQPRSVHLIVLPHFWQTWWFLGVTGLASAGAVAAIVSFAMRRRLRQKLETIERQRAVERERARIAKDIHDELGASLTRITMLSQSARDELEASPAADEVDRIYDTARDLTRAMDEIVWAVNPKHDTLDSLATYLGKFAQDFLAAAHIRCRLEMPIQLPSWPLTAEIRHNLFLAFKEALNNAVKHAATTEVRIFVDIGTEQFTLRVEDSGAGFSTSGAANGSDGDPLRFSHGNGLRNMRERLEEIGGRCEIRSASGSGTTVTFRVPVGSARATVMRIDDTY